MAKKWINNAIKRPGALHRHLGIPEGEKIPQEKMEEAMRSKNPRIRKEAALAHTLSGFHHKKKANHGLSAKHVMHKLYHS